MSSAAIIAIAVGIVVILAALSFVTLARRSDVRGAGALSGETVERDRAAREERQQDEVVAAPTQDDGRGAGRDRPLRHRSSHLSRRRPSLRGRRPTRRRSVSAAGSSSTGRRSR